MPNNLTTVAFSGIDVVPVEVQINFVNGMPSFVVVGLGDKAVAESKERIRAAINSLGLSMPAKKIIINLAPASLNKEGSHFDLAMVIGVLVEIGVIDSKSVEEYIILGELSLDGRVNRVNGVLPATIYAISQNKKIICPTGNITEVAWLSDKIEIIAPYSVLDLINHFKGQQLIDPVDESSVDEIEVKFSKSLVDMKDVNGNQSAKRALEIAACGGHNVLMSGHPGSGKSMLAQRMITILPPMDYNEILETRTIQSIAGNYKDEMTNIRPYRNPHHSASVASIVGGGRDARPGEITLSHNGVLFLDELPEFPRAVLESLRQPLENGTVTISRVNSHITYPANFQLIGAMNPCKCGYFGDKDRECRKAPDCANDYQGKLSGPFMDRIDLFFTVNTELNSLFNSSKESNESSAVILARVIKVNEFQKERAKKKDSVFIQNSRLSLDRLNEYCLMSSDDKLFSEKVANNLKLSVRGYIRMLRLALTIADMNFSDRVKREHISEALTYRNN